MVGRLRLVHRTSPARVFLLTNLPTALPVDRLATWDEASCPARWSRPSSPAGACCRCPAPSWRGCTPACGPRPRRSSTGMARKGAQVPIRELYWNVGTLSVATLVSYRRPGQRRGSPHQAIIPGDVRCPATAAQALEPLLGVSGDVRIVEMLARPGDRPAAAAVLSPEHEEAGTIPEPAPGRVRDHSPWQVPSPFEPEAVRRAVEPLLGVVEDARPAETLHRPGAAQPAPHRRPIARSRLLKAPKPVARACRSAGTRVPTIRPGPIGTGSTTASPAPASGLQPHGTHRRCRRLGPRRGRDRAHVGRTRPARRSPSMSRPKRAARTRAWSGAAATAPPPRRGRGSTGGHASNRGRLMASPAPTMSPAAPVRSPPRSRGHRGEPPKHRCSSSLPIVK